MPSVAKDFADAVNVVIIEAGPSREKTTQSYWRLGLPRAQSHSCGRGCRRIRQRVLGVVDRYQPQLAGKRSGRCYAMTGKTGCAWIIRARMGFLNVLMLLKWWRDAMEEGSPDWEEAVNDVTWVLQQMNECSEDNPILPDATTNPATATSAPLSLKTRTSPRQQTKLQRMQGAREEGRRLTTTHLGVPPQLPHPPPRPKPRPLNRGMLDRDVPSEAEPMREPAGLLLGTEGLSQEELDEINADMEADMDEDEE
ncbi:hypothetical protein MSAN_02036000 [Mycena sanguinolenta]|uniref:Uncharacterized protein n=1 Tax=Mycena sanguinolenta TaxID=230812 RepID=A0A8H6XJV6_9AGAR|nr:hypothetical protein MSAN_02036000 [Mycena sanguinolenta]